MCGCGTPTSIANYNDARDGSIKGRPTRFIKGHCVRVYGISNETREKIRRAVTGKKHSPETLARFSEMRRGRKQRPETIERRRKSLIGKRRTPEQIARLAQIHRNRSEQTRRNIAAAKMGERNPMWKGGVTPDRCTSQHIKWSRAIKKRDNYTCQMCGLQSKRGMEAHHVYSFTKYPSKRYDLDNGVTLCKPCHWTQIKQKEPQSLLDMAFGQGA